MRLIRSKLHQGGHPTRPESEGVRSDASGLVQETSLEEAYDQLSKLTNKSVRGASSVSIASRGLDALPPHVCVLLHLRRLDVSFNKLSTLPPSLAQLRNLAHLVLSGNAFKEMPVIIEQLFNLETLVVQKNQIVHLPALKGLNKLRELDLFMNAVETVDAAFGTSLPVLSSLLLRANRISQLPPILPNSITQIDLSSNPISELPAALIALPRLSILECVSCNMSVVPANLPTSLVTLHLSRNLLLKEIPNLILPLLADFNAVGCLISSIKAETFAQCPLLRFVNLDSNPISRCVMAPTLTRLEKLALCQCPLREGPILPPKSKIVELVLAETPINSITNVLAQSAGPTLRRLYLQSATIEMIPAECMDVLVLLEEVSFRSNVLKTFPVPSVPHINLHSLDLASNAIRALPDELFVTMPQLVRLDLACNKLSTIPPSLWECCPQLRYLNVFNNRLKMLPGRLEAMHSLVELFAGNNRLTEFPGTASNQLVALRTLHLAGNSIQQLPAGTSFPQLEKCFLGRNAFRDIPNDLHRSKKLECLDLSGNKLTFVVVSIEFPALTELILSHNSISKFSVEAALFPKGFAQAFPMLTCLDLSDNPMDIIPSFGPNNALEIVNMLHCGIMQLTAKQQKEMENIHLVYMQGNPIESNRRTLRASYVEKRTDLIISDLKRPQLFGRTQQQAAGEAQSLMGVAWSEIKGGRSTQEDTITIAQRRDDAEHLFGVFDGHRGSDVSQHCAINFAHFVKHAVVSFPGDPAHAITAAFHQLSDSIIEQGLTAGSTAAVALVQDKCITLGHLGDARAVLYTVMSPDNPQTPENVHKHITKTILALGSANVVAVATLDHTAKNKMERQRVERDLGGYVSEQGRIMGDIAVTRALGDGQFSPFIVSEPGVVVVPRTGAELFLIVACDGFWDVVTVTQAYHLVESYMRDPCVDLARVALVLRDYAFCMGSTDNISIVVVHGLGVSSPRPENGSSSEMN